MKLQITLPTDAEITQFYSRYKSALNEHILACLQTITLVAVTNKGIGTVHGYYPYAAESMAKILSKPRGYSVNFDVQTASEPVLGLTPWKTIPFLVKSSSHFFLKADVGEVFDQLSPEDLASGKIKAICVNERYDTLAQGEGCHHIMYATLLTGE